MNLYCQHCGRLLLEVCRGHPEPDTVRCYSDRCLCRLPTETITGLMEGREEAVAAYRAFLSDWMRRWGVPEDRAVKAAKNPGYPVNRWLREAIGTELLRRKRPNGSEACGQTPEGGRDGRQSHKRQFGQSRRGKKG